MSGPREVEGVLTHKNRMLESVSVKKFIFFSPKVFIPAAAYPFIYIAGQRSFPLLRRLPSPLIRAHATSPPPACRAPPPPPQPRAAAVVRGTLLSLGSTNRRWPNRSRRDGDEGGRGQQALHVGRIAVAARGRFAQGLSIDAACRILDAFGDPS